MKKMKYCLCALILFAAMPLFAQDPAAAAAEPESAFSVFVSTGFGFSYNMYLEDTQNELVDGYEKNGFTEDTGNSSASLLYGGFGINPRYETGNIVLSIPVSYYNVMKSRRTVVQGASKIISKMDLAIWSVSFIADYKIRQSDSSYLLIGGGAGYYKGSMYWDVITNGVSDKDSDSSWTIGWQTDLEYHWLFGNIDFYLGATSRFAEIISFSVRDPKNDNNMVAGLTGLNFSAGIGYRF